MEDTFSIQDESGDRKYFTIIPNYILNHSTLYDRELYVQMKRMAGEKGTCYASRTTLARQCGMSPRKVDASIKYLIEHEWIRKIGTKTVQTAGGPQQVGEYAIADLWKKNIEFYEEKKQGVAHNAIPYTQRGSTDEAKGVAPGAHKEELNTKKNISEQSSRSYEITETPEKEEKEQRPTKAVYEPLLRWAEGERGSNFVSRTKQYKALQCAKAAGLKSVELKERWLEMAEEEFWQKHGFDWTHVVSSFDRKGV